MPTESDAKSLLEGCNIISAAFCNVNTQLVEYGYLFESKTNGNRIFLPSIRNQGGLAVYTWTATLPDYIVTHAFAILYSSDDKKPVVAVDCRYFGEPVRPVVRM